MQGREAQRAHHDLNAPDGGRRALSGSGVGLRGRGNLQAAVQRFPDHGAGQRMVGLALDGGGQGQHLALGVAEAGQAFQARLPVGQGAGFVKGDGPDMGQRFEGLAALDQQPTPGARRHRRHHGSRHRQQQRTRAADQQQRQGAVDPGVQLRAEKQRRQQGGHRRQPQDPRHVGSGEAVQKMSRRRAPRLGVAHQFQGAGDGVFACAVGHPHAQRTVQIHGSGPEHGARSAHDRNALAGQERLVQSGFPVYDHAVGRQAVPRAHQDQLAASQLLTGPLVRVLAVQDVGRGR